MPITFTITDDFLETVMSGQVAEAEIIAYWQQLLADPASAALRVALIDLRGMAGGFSSRSVRRLAEEAAKMNVSRRALLVSDTLSHGLLRTFATSTEHTGVRYNIFTDRENALEWLREAS